MKTVDLSLNEGFPREYANFKHPLVLREFNYSSLRAINALAYDGGGIIDKVENAFASLVQRPFAMSTNSGTSALAAAFEGAGLQEGDEVIVPCYTFFATAMPLFRIGVTPVLADCEENGNVSAKTISQCIGPRTKAVVVVHLWGIPCEMCDIEALCRENSLLLIEDASHAHGASIANRAIGSFGIASAFSLGARKVITGGQGGMLVTNNQELLERATLLAHYNRRGERDVSLPHLQPYSTTGTGYNLRMHPYAAALIMPQIEAVQRTRSEREETAQLLRSRLQELPGITLPTVPDDAAPSWYAFTVLYTPPSHSSPTRDEIVSVINSYGATEVDAPCSTCPLTNFAIFREKARFSFELGNSKADSYHAKVIKLPTWYGDDRLKFAVAHVHAFEKAFQQLGLKT